MAVAGSRGFPDPGRGMETVTGELVRPPTAKEAYEWRPSEHAMELAANFVLDAARGRKVGYQVDRNSLWWRRLFHTPVYRNFITLIAVLHMLLVLIEAPSALRLKHRTPDTQAPEPPPDGWSHQNVALIELAIVLVYVFDIFVQCKFMGVVTYARSWNFVEAVVTTIFLSDVVTTLGGLVKLQYSRVLRPTFLVTKRRHIRFIISGVVRSVVGMAPVLLLLLLLMLCFAFVGSLAFSTSVKTYADMPSQFTTYPPLCSSLVGATSTCDNYFSSVGQALYHLNNLVTKTEWPGMILPFYEREEWSAVYFVVFCLIGHFILLRLLLAVVFADFKAYCSAAYVRRQRRSRAAFAAAYRLVSRGGFVSLQVWRTLARRVRGSIPISAADAVFRAVGGDEGFLGRTGFIAACTLLDVKVARMELPVPPVRSDDGETSPSGGPRRRGPPEVEAVEAERAERILAWRRFLARIFRSTTYEVVNGVMVLGAAAIALLQSEPLTDDNFFQWEGSQPAEVILRRAAIVEAFSILIALFFALELLLKVFALSLRGYWKDGFNKVDGIVAITVLLSLCLDAAALIAERGNADKAYDSTIFRVAVVLRATRFLRALKLMRRYWRVLATLRALGPLLTRVLVVLFLTCYIGAVVGMELFAGVLGNGAKSDPRVVDSAYGTHGLWALNFNSFTRSFVIQFAVLMTTGYTQIVEGTMAGLDSWYPLLYWEGVFVVLVLVVVNVLMALIIQTYSAKFQRESQRGTGLVEAWEHLLMVSQLELAEERDDPDSIWARPGSKEAAADRARADSLGRGRSVQPDPSVACACCCSNVRGRGTVETDVVILWRMKRPSEFKVLGESLFGEALTCDFVPTSLRVVSEYSPEAQRLGLEAEAHEAAADALEREAADADEAGLAEQIGRVAAERGAAVMAWRRFQAVVDAKRHGARTRCLTDFVTSPYAFLLAGDDFTAELEELSDLLADDVNKTDNLSASAAATAPDWGVKSARTAEESKSARTGTTGSTTTTTTNNNNNKTRTAKPRIERAAVFARARRAAKVVSMLRAMDLTRRSAADAAEAAAPDREEPFTPTAGTDDDSSPWVSDAYDRRFDVDSAEELARRAAKASGWEGFSEGDSLLLGRGLRRGVRRRWLQAVDSLQSSHRLTIGGGGGGGGSSNVESGGGEATTNPLHGSGGDHMGSGVMNAPGMTRSVSPPAGARDFRPATVSPAPGKNEAAEAWYLAVAEARRVGGRRAAEQHAARTARDAAGAEVPGIRAMFGAITNVFRGDTSAADDAPARPRSSTVGSVQAASDNRRQRVAAAASEDRLRRRDPQSPPSSTNRATAAADIAASRRRASQSPPDSPALGPPRATFYKQVTAQHAAEVDDADAGINYDFRGVISESRDGRKK